MLADRREGGLPTPPELEKYCAVAARAGADISL